MSAEELKRRLRLSVDALTSLTVTRDDCSVLLTALGGERCEFSVRLGVSPNPRRCLLDRGHGGPCRVG